MSIDVMRWVWRHRHPEQTPVDRLVLLALADQADDDGVTWVEPPALTVKVDASLSAVYESLARLKRTAQIRAWKEDGRSFRQVLMPVDALFQILEPVQDSECPIPESGIPPTPPYKDDPPVKGNPQKDGRPAAIEAIYEAWKASTGRNGNTRLTTEKRQKINARLGEGFTVDQLVTVVTDGWRADPWPERVHQNDLTQLLTNASKVEKFLALAANPPRGSSRPAPPRREFQTYEQSGQIPL